MNVLKKQLFSDQIYHSHPFLVHHFVLHFDILNCNFLKINQFNKLFKYFCISKVDFYLFIFTTIATPVLESFGRYSNLITVSTSFTLTRIKTEMNVFLKRKF